MIEDFFASLQHTGDIPADVAAYLTCIERTGTLQHIRQVVTQARTLAARFGADVQAASIAAWCHDLAVGVPHMHIVRVAEAWGVLLTESERAIPQVLHGPLAAAVARQKLGLHDEDILNAIRHHTTLRAGASTLEKVVFVADKIALDPTSPRRDFLPALRAALDDGLDAAAFVYLDWVVRHNDVLGWTLHANLLAAHAELAPRFQAES